MRVTRAWGYPGGEGWGWAIDWGMVVLKPDECRVLGVLIEKALTTPQQYPLTLNALTVGCNQKNNRLPVVEWDEERVLDAVESLRHKGLVREALLSGSRVAKYRHLGREVLQADTAEIAILAELWLRGPQTLGELRQHAGRMQAFASLEALEAIVRGLMGREPALVREYPPAPGTRASLFAQTLCPDLHRVEARADSSGAEAGSAAASSAAAAGGGGNAGGSGGLAARVEALEREVAEMRRLLAELGVTGSGGGG